MTRHDPASTRELVVLTDEELGALADPAGSDPAGAGTPLVLLPHWERLGGDREAVRACAWRSLAARGLAEPPGPGAPPRAHPPLDDLLRVRSQPESLLMIHRTRSARGGVDLLTRYVYAVGELALLEDVNALGLHRFATTAVRALPAALGRFLSVPPASGGVASTGAPVGPTPLDARRNGHPREAAPALLDLRDERARSALGEATLVADVLARPPGPEGPAATRTAHALFVLPGGAYAGTAPVGGQPLLLRRLDESIGPWAAALLTRASDPDGAVRGPRRDGRGAAAPSRASEDGRESGHE